MITDSDLVAYSNRMTNDHFTVAMWHVQGHKYKEIASLLNIPVGTVKSRLSRAKGVITKLKGQEQGENAG